MSEQIIPSQRIGIVSRCEKCGAWFNAEISLMTCPECGGHTDVLVTERGLTEWRHDSDKLEKLVQDYGYEFDENDEPIGDDTGSFDYHEPEQMNDN